MILRALARTVIGLAVLVLAWLLGWLGAGLVHWIMGSSIGQTLMILPLVVLGALAFGVCYHIGELVLERLGVGPA